MVCKISKWRITAGILLAALLFPLSLAASDQGISGARVLKQGVSARALGMGEACVAITGDMQSLYYNPAGLGRLEVQETGFMYIKSVADTSYGYLGYARPMYGGGLAGSVATFQGGEIEINEDNGSSRTLKAQSDYVISLGYGFKVQAVSIGATAKMFISTLVEEYNAQAYAVDLVKRQP